jgi:hypothetical protein
MTQKLLSGQQSRIVPLMIFTGIGIFIYPTIAEKSRVQKEFFWPYFGFNKRRY